MKRISSTVLMALALTGCVSASDSICSAKDYTEVAEKIDAKIPLCTDLINQFGIRGFDSFSCEFKGLIKPIQVDYDNLMNSISNDELLNHPDCADELRFSYSLDGISLVYTLVELVVEKEKLIRRQ